MKYVVDVNLKTAPSYSIESWSYFPLQGRSRLGAAIYAQAAAVAERLEATASPYIQEPGKGLGFYTGTDGYLYADNMRIDDIRSQVTHKSQNISSIHDEASLFLTHSREGTCFDLCCAA